MKLEEKNGKNGKMHLSVRQVQVLQGVGRGESSKETAVRMKISVRTVEDYRERCMRTLGAHKSSQAYAIAVDCGLLKPKKEGKPKIKDTRRLRP
jgi:DNA-binding NarL/FixJ family response regulator